MKKIVKKLLVSSSLLILAFVMSVCAFGDSVDLALTVGRGTAISSNGLSAKLEPISDGSDIKDMFSVPVVVNESTYVPFRYVFEKIGLVVDYDATTKITSLKKQNGKIPVYGIESTAVNCLTVEFDGDSVVYYHDNGKTTKEPSSIYKYLGMTYIPARYLERFGALIKWDAANSVVYISYEESEGFRKKFERIYNLSDAKEKQSATDSHFEKIVTTSALKQKLDSYLSSGTDSFNNQNGGLALQYNGKNYYPNINIEKDGWFNKIGDTNSRQLCYAETENEKMIYYVDRANQQLRRFKLETEDIVKDRHVKLPSYLDGKKITHLTSYDGNIFYVAYDNANDGGHIYMSRIGNEEKSTVKITKDKAWNYYISPTYKLYFMNFSEGYRLTSIDLRALENTGVFVDKPTEGVLSYIVNATPMQSFAFDCSNATDYYYVDIVNGDLIKSSRNHNTGIEVLKTGNEYNLKNFLNVGHFGGKKSVIYVEYANGKSLNFDKCKIVQYGLDDKSTTVLYDSDFAINGLCVLGGKIYFTDMNYSALYMLEYSGSEIKVSKVGQ